MAMASGESKNSASRLSGVGARLQISIGCTHNLTGAALAARTVLRCVKNAHSFYPQNVNRDWLDAVESYARDLERDAGENGTLLQAQSALSESKVYGSFVAHKKTTLLTLDSNRLYAAMGLVLVYCASIAKPISVGAMAAFNRLHLSGIPRAGRHQDWSDFSKSIPRSVEEVKAWQTRTEQKDLQSLLAGMTSALETPIQSTAALERPDHPSQENVSDDESTPGTRNARQQAPGRYRNKQHLTPPPKSLLGWLIQRSNQTEFTGHFGVTDRWEQQTKDELRFACRKILEVLNSDTLESKYAFFSIICLASGLPADLAVNIKLQPNTDLWFDQQTGLLHWCTLRATNAKLAKEISHSEIDDSQIVDIYLPQAAAEVGRTLSQLHKDSDSVGMLVTGRNTKGAIEAFIDEYRTWLTSTGARSLHKIYDARWARSIGQIYREISTDVAAALLGLNFDECALGMLAYVCMSTQTMHELTSRAYEVLGLGPAVEFSSPSRHVGSVRAMHLTEFIQGMVGLLKDRDQQLTKLQSAATPETVCAIFNSIVHSNCLAYISTSAARGHHLERITYGTVIGHKQLTLLEDKDIDDLTDCRAVPVHDALRSVIYSHLKSITLFAERMRKFGIPPGRPQARSFDDDATHRVFFCQAKLTTKAELHYIARQQLDRETLNELSIKFFNGHINVGRHTLISEFVRLHVIPWLTKILSGHFRGQADPFAEGLSLPPKYALEQLLNVLDWVFQELPEQYKTAPCKSAPLLGLAAARLPSLGNESQRSSRSRARVLPPAFDHYTFIAIRVIDQLRQMTVVGEGPSHPGANFLLNLIVINWVLYPDLKTAWQTKTRIRLLTQVCPAITWNRHGCRAQIRRNIEHPTAVALAEIGSDLSDKWQTSCKQLQVWLNDRFPRINWPVDPESTLASLSALTSRWMRFNLPPFLLTAASPKLTAPTLDEQSIARLAQVSDAAASQLDEVLIFPPPKRRGTGNIKPAPSALQELMDVVDKYGRRKPPKADRNSGNDTSAAHLLKPEASDWALMKAIRKETAVIDASNHAPARTYKLWVTREAQRWSGSLGERIEAGSLCTYSSNFKQALLILRPNEDMKLWGAEWYDWIHFIKTTSPGETREERESAFATRIIAIKRFIKVLREEGYHIPHDLFDSSVSANDGMRLSATSTLLLKRDQSRIQLLMKNHFGMYEVESQIADLYTQLHWCFAGRSSEFGALQLNCLDSFGRLVIALDYFSLIKSEHGRRILSLPDEVIDKYKSICAVIKSAYPDSKFLFLLDDPGDWRFVDQLEAAFSQCLKQVLGSTDARPHLTRLVAPLEALIPGWELILNKLLNGLASSHECETFVAGIRSLGFTHLIQMLLAIGHGHPVTFLKYYLSIWDLLMSLYCRASLATIENPRRLIFNRRKKFLGAFDKAQSRAQPDFDSAQWLIAKLLANADLKLDKPYQVAIPPIVTNKQPEMDVDVRSSLQLVRYTACRFAGFGPAEASFHFAIDSKSAAKVEGIIVGGNFNKLLEGHQSKPSSRSKQALIDYLSSNHGARLVRSVRAAPASTREQLLESLHEKRTYNQHLPAANHLINWLTSLLSCLVPELGLIVQFGEGRLDAADVQRISSCSARIFVGPADRDLGGRPRLCVIDMQAPHNLVRRPRLTSATRCILAAIQLLKTF